MKAKDFDAKFDRGEDISQWIDPKSIRRPALEPRRVNVDFPAWVIQTLDREAERVGISRQSLIKVCMPI